MTVQPYVSTGASATPRHRLERAIQQLHNESLGLWRVSIITSASAAALHAAALQGDDDAAALLSATAQFLDRTMALRTQHQAVPCALCSSPLWCRYPPRAVGILAANCDKPRIALALGCCRACVSARTDQELAHAMVDALRAGPLPGARIIPPPCQAGHA